MARVLVAGSDASSTDVLSEELMGEGHEVIEAFDGFDAYTLTLSEHPDMVFLEIALPVFNGYETCAMIRDDPEVPPDLPIIVIATGDTDARRLEKAGATAILARAHAEYELQDLLAAYLPPEAFPDVQPPT